jgi:hypothetical protein
MFPAETFAATINRVTVVGRSTITSWNCARFAELQAVDTADNPYEGLFDVTINPPLLLRSIVEITVPGVVCDGSKLDDMIPISK